MTTSRFLPPTYPTPDAALVAAARELGQSAWEVLADHLEEVGHPQAAAVRRGFPRWAAGQGQVAAALDALLAVRPDPRDHPLTLEDVPALFARAGEAAALTPAERLAAFLRVRADGRRGVVRLRERQEKVRQRLAKPAPGLGLGVSGHALRRCRRQGQVFLDRDARRARRTGDDLFVVALGNAYHARVRPLYTSQRAGVAYGSGGVVRREEVYRGSYKASYGAWATWRDAGARVEYPEGRPVAVLETSRGREVARFPIPDHQHRGHVTTDGVILLDGDLWGVHRRVGGAEVVVRYGLGRRKGGLHAVVRTGVALRLATGRWEHGESVDACRREALRKAEAARARAEAARADRPAVGHVARLLARHCPDLVEVTHADRRRAGYCDPGTAAFLARHGLDGREAVTALELRRTGRAEVERPVEEAALRLARELLAPATAVV